MSIYIQNSQPKLTAPASQAQSLEHWSRDLDVANSIPSRSPWSCNFRNSSWLGLKNVCLQHSNLLHLNYRYLMKAIPSTDNDQA